MISATQTPLEVHADSVREFLVEFPHRKARLDAKIASSEVKIVEQLECGHNENINSTK